MIFWFLMHIFEIWMSKDTGLRLILKSFISEIFYISVTISLYFYKILRKFWSAE